MSEQFFRVLWSLAAVEVVASFGLRWRGLVRAEHQFGRIGWDGSFQLLSFAGAGGRWSCTKGAHTFEY